MATRQPFNIIDGVLILAIVGLTFLLFYVIWEPGQVLAKMEDYKWESRARMNSLRIAQQQYYNAKETYSDDMDSLIIFVRDEIDPAYQDSLFQSLYLYKFNLDSIRFAPLSHTVYELAIDDTTSIPRYQVTCPDGFGYIGSLTNPDEHNKASWEQ